MCLIVDREHLFPDNWIYVHEPAVKVARIQNFKNWSPAMVPDPAKSSLGLEYFCNEGDALWLTPDAELIELAKRELETIGLARAQDVSDGCVFRMPKAYPVYDSDYRGQLELLQQYLAGFENCLTIGRNGLHRYNNQDHSMLTGLYAAQDVVRGERRDLWAVNADADYHEELAAPTRSPDALARRALRLLLARLDPVALGVASGSLAGAGLALATLALVLKGGEVVGPNMALLAVYFPGFHVTLAGSLVGLAYGAVSGYLLGFVFAHFRNAAVLGYVKRLRRKARREHLDKLLDEV